MNLREWIKLVEQTETLEHALWWLQRWISGSMDDPDWEWPEAEAMNVLHAFQMIGKNSREQVFDQTRNMAFSNRLKTHGTEDH